MTMSLDKCPACGGELIRKPVDKLLRGGTNTAIVTVVADVCLHCGERLYDEATVRRFDEIRAKLAKQDTAGLRAAGRTFEVA